MKIKYLLKSNNLLVCFTLLVMFITVMVQKTSTFAEIKGPMVQRDPVTSGKLVELQHTKSSFIGTNMWYKSFDGEWHYLDGKGQYTVGFYHDLDDDNWYYFDDAGNMVTGWVTISDNLHYFSEQANNDNWYYDDNEAKYKTKEKGIKSLGSMYINEYTPDGKFVDDKGIYIKNNKK